MNASAVAAARTAIAAFGYEAVVPSSQGCCGAMHTHGGEPEAGIRQRERNAAAFKAAGVDEVIVVGTGDIGLAPAFFPPLSWMYTERARAARELFILLARQTGVEYVDLFRKRDDDPVRKDPAGFFAPDRLHPGSEAYSLWYGELMRQSSLADILQHR